METARLELAPSHPAKMVYLPIILYPLNKNIHKIDILYRIPIIPNTKLETLY